MRRREPTPAEVLGTCLSLAQEVQRSLPPAPRRRGRPFTYPLLGTWPSCSFGPSITSPTGARWPGPRPSARRHLSQHLLSCLLKALGQRLESTLGEGEEGPFFLLDSTGLPYRRKGTLLRWTRGKEKRMRSHSRLCLLVRSGAPVQEVWRYRVLLCSRSLDRGPRLNSRRNRLIGWRRISPSGPPRPPPRPAEAPPLSAISSPLSRSRAFW
ncbi:hypothetical protein HRbin23_00401 [bacterium HR23]|nr:hypothetical protein HRbin23_00401 [bacterium HR23]